MICAHCLWNKYEIHWFIGDKHPKCTECGRRYKKDSTAIDIEDAYNEVTSQMVKLHTKYDYSKLNKLSNILYDLCMEYKWM